MARGALCPPESDMKATGEATGPWRDDKDCDEGANWEIVKDTELAEPGFCGGTGAGGNGDDDDGDGGNGGDGDGDGDNDNDGNGDGDNGDDDNGDDAEAALEVS